MIFTTEQNLEFNDFFETRPSGSSSASVEEELTAPVPVKPAFFDEKLRVPELKGYLWRPRLDRLMRRSLEQVGAVLVTGRAGTGKTSMVTHYAREYGRTIWYRVEAADSDWKVFSSYLSACVGAPSPECNGYGIAGCVEKLLGEIESRSPHPALLVLDDIHNVFDTPWFDEFLLTLLYSLSPQVHLILVSRSLPVLPLWRLRSKQVLTVIDEKVIAFNEKEVEEFCYHAGVPAEQASALCVESFGRIGKLKSLLGTP